MNTAAFVKPVILRACGVRLEPLSLSHEAGLAAAASDGALWKLRLTSVPEPQDTLAYIDTALQARAQGHRFARIGQYQLPRHFARRATGGNWLHMVRR